MTDEALRDAYGAMETNDDPEGVVWLRNLS